MAHDESRQDRITRFWNTIAAGYEAHEGNVAALSSDEYKAWVVALRDMLPPAPADVLDVGTPQFPAGSFDVIMARHLLWTLREPEEAFQNWRSLLRHNGRVVAIDGHWFGGGDDSDDFDAPELFCRHYTRDTRSVLPLMMASGPQTAIEMFRRTGFAAVELSYLTRAHALAEHPPSKDPWFVLVATR